MGIFSTRRSKAVAGAVGGFGIAGGVAAAAILLTTTINGSASVVTVPGTANEVSVDVTANAPVNGSALNCSDLVVSPDSKTLTFNPKLTKVANGANASSQPVPGGSCTIRVNVKNTGSTSIKVDNVDLRLPQPGWTVVASSGLDKAIAPGATQELTASIQAGQDAVGGSVSGQLVYTDS